MTDRERFEKIQQRWAKASDRLDATRDALRRRYGTGAPPAAWITKGEQAKLDAAHRAQDREMDAMFALLDRVSRRRWRSGVAAWWVMEKLTWDDAVTTGTLSMLPQPGYGLTVRDAERFAAPLD